LFAVLFRRHVRDVHRFVWRRTQDDGLADDLTAMTFERCWTALPDYEPKRSSLRPWLFRIAANSVASHYRAEGRRRRREHFVSVRDEPLVVSTDPANSLSDIEFGDRSVLDAMGRLDQRHHEVLSLRFLADLTTAEAADAMGVGSSHFAVMQYRALAALKRQLEGTS
jgi:RNA polymerase sigma-70 factor (ECF subfamily)